MELQHLRFFALWSSGENLGSGLPDRMMVLCLRQHYLLGGPNDGSCCCAWLRVGCLVVVVRPAWGRRWWFFFMCFSSAVLRVVSVLLLCMLKTLPWLPMCCCELRALGVLLVHLC